MPVDDSSRNKSTGIFFIYLYIEAQFRCLTKLNLTKRNSKITSLLKRKDLLHKSNVVY